MRCQIYEKYGGRDRYGVIFGSGEPVSLIDEESKTNYGAAFAEAWRNGCPVPGAVIDGYGSKWARGRYSETSDLYWHVGTIIRKFSSSLNQEYKVTRTRRNGEKKPLLHEPRNVPSNHLVEIAPLSFIAGYAIPRIVIEEIRANERVLGNADYDFKSTVVGAVTKSQNTLELLVHTAESAVNSATSPRRVLHHLLSKGNLREERTYRAFDEIAVIMQEVAPNLWQVYQGLSAQDRKKLDVVTFRELRHPKRLTCRPE